MRYKLYKIKNESPLTSHDRLFVYDTITEHILYLYLWIEHSTDYFKTFLDEGVPPYTNRLIDRINEGFLELEHYDLIEEFDNPRDSLIIKEEYENILWERELSK